MFQENVDERFAAWLDEQERTGQKFTPEQVEWLEMLKEHIDTSLKVEVDDLELAAFLRAGRAGKSLQALWAGA